MAFNKIILQGNLTADPEVKATPTGVSVCRFGIAVQRRYKNESGAAETDFIDCVAWRSTADFLGKYFTKGTPILVCGSLQMRKWEDKEGNKRISAEVIADEVTFTAPKGDAAPASVAAPTPANTGKAAYMPEAYQGASGAKFEPVEDEDGLPF
jgi:single-strand DNA-binding protein